MRTAPSALVTSITTRHFILPPGSLIRPTVAPPGSGRSLFDFLGYCFRPRAVWGSRSGRLFRGDTRGQSLGVESHAGEDQGLEHSSTNAVVAGRNRRTTESAPSGVDHVLRAILTVGAASLAVLRQSDVARLGETEVQALQDA